MRSAHRAIRLFSGRSGFTNVLATFFVLLPALAVQAENPAVATRKAAAERNQQAVTPAPMHPIQSSMHPRMPIVFAANQGQSPAGTLYEAQAGGLQVLLAKTGVTLRMERPTSAPAAATPKVAASAAGAGPSDLKNLRNYRLEQQSLQFVGASSNMTVEPLEEQPGKVSYFFGNDPKHWVTNLKTYARIRYHNLYPGIDLVFYSHNGQLEYDFVVAAGADPNQIRLQVDGNDPMQVLATGELQIGSGKDAVLHQPVLYQNLNNGKKLVAGKFIRVAGNTVGFEFAGYDKTRTFIIDPKINLVYSTFAGGIHDDQAYGVALDAAGNAYVTGFAASQDFPVTGNALQSTRMNIGTYTYDVIVMKFDPSGTLLYSTFLGGGATELGYTIAVDAAGDAFVGGYTQSSDFPVTQGAFQSTYGGGKDAFLSKISPDGSQLLYSTYLGGSGDEYIGSLLLNSDGSLWMSGGASAAGLPASANAFQVKPNGEDNYFVAKAQFNQSGALQIPYLTFIGGSNPNEEAFWGELAADSTGNVYLAGATQSSDFPVTSNAYQKPVPLSDGCAIGAKPNSIWTMTKFSPDLSKMLYSTEIGGSTEAVNGGNPDCNQAALSIHLDAQGNIWMAGTTGASDFPVTASALSKQLNGNGNGGVDYGIVELSADGSKELYGSYFGGSTYDYGDRAVWDASGNIWIHGNTESSDYPVTSDALQSTNAGGYDTTLTELSPDATKILYSTYLGGSGDDDVQGGGAIAVDASGNVHLAGETASANFPVTPDAFQGVFANGDQGADGADVYYTVLGSGTIGTIGPVVGGNIGDASVTVDGAGIQQGATCSLVQGGTTIASAQATVNSTGTSIICTFPLNGAATGSYDVAINNPDGSSFIRPGGFTVEAGTGPNIWLSIVGRSAIRFNTLTTFTVSFGNSGDTDAVGVPIFVSVPAGATIQLATKLAPVPPLTDFNPDTLPTAYVMNTATSTSTFASGTTVIPIFIPRISAGGSGSLQFQITMPSTVTSTQVTVYNWTPFASSLDDFVKAFSSSANSPTALNLRERAALRLLPQSSGITLDPNAAAKCINDLAQLGLQIAGALVPGSACATSAAGYFGNLVTTVVSANSGDFSASDAGSSLGQLYAAAGQTALNCALAAAGSTPVGLAVNAALALIQGGLQGASAAADCGQVAQPQNPQNWNPQGVGAIDPNDKAGPNGDGSSSRYIKSRPITYNVAFENKPAATAPASQVIVTDQLDPTKVDLASLSLGTLGFGSTVINPPAGVSNFSTTDKINSSLNVRIQGSLDADTGLLKWTFTSIDPSTGLPPTDPTVGFLPPDADGMEGQAFVTFNVMPKAGATTGTQVTNMATVVFDSNAPINTPSWMNTLDVDAPASQVTALPSQSLATVNVAWSGTDKGSGVASYSIFVSDNGGPFTAWQSNVTTTSATFTGTVGHTYGFLSEATDKAGNTEAVKTTADTSTQIVSTLPPDFALAATTGSLSIAPGASGTVTLNVTPMNGFNQAVAFACSGLPSEAICSFSPTTVTPTGSAASTTLTITTTGPTNSSRNSLPWPFAGGGIVAACGLLFFRRKRQFRLSSALSLLFLLTTTGMLLGCGGGGSSKTTGNPGTPAGTSSVVVTATSGTGAGAVSHTTTISLTVQ